MRKKLPWVCGLLSLFLVFVLGGCTSQDDSLLDPSKPITITFWHYYGDYVTAQLTEIVDEFNETVGKEHGVIVETVGKPSIAQLEIELSEAAQGVIYSDPMPDMFLAYPDKILELQQQDIVTDLNLYLTEEDTSHIITTFLESGLINDQQVMLPVVKSTELLYLNDTYWQPFAQQYGYSYEDFSTWERILVVAEDYYSYSDGLTPDIPGDGKALFGLDSLENFIVVSSKQLGVDIFDAASATAVLDSQVLEQIFTTYAKAMSLGYFDSVGQFRSDDIRSGDIIGYVGSSASYAYIPDWVEDDGEKVDIAWVPLPYPSFEGCTPYVLSQGAGVAISTNSEQSQEASALFLNFFLDYNVAFALKSAYVPVTTDFLLAEEDMLALLAPYELEDNELQVYSLVLDQVEQDVLYQTSAFDGSYTVRSELANSLAQLTTACQERADYLFDSGLTEEAVLETLDLHQQCSNALSTVRSILEQQGIAVEMR